MELRVLRYFLTVAREENITRVAELLYITQPTLSKQIQQLEEEIGTQLIIRGTRKVTLTQAGIYLQNRAEEIISLVYHTKSELQEHATEVNGLISIGIPESDAGQKVIGLLKSFQELYPKVTYDIYTGTADMVKERMDKGLFDVGLLMVPTDVEKYHYIAIAQKEQWGILLPSNSPLALKKKNTREDIIDKPLMIPKRNKMSKELAQWFQCDVADLKITATFNLTMKAVIMVQNGIGFATVVGGSFLGDLEHKVCFRPFYPEVSSDSLLAWKKYQIFSPTITKFLEHVRQGIEPVSSEA